MTKRRTIIALLALVALVVGVLVSARTREPSYNGRTLSEWLEIYRFAGTEKIPWDQREKAAEAVRAIGTNALPFLLDWIRYEPSVWQHQLSRSFSPGSMPHFIDGLTFDGELLDRSFAATDGLQILGSTALPVLPDLLRLINDTNSEVAGRSAFRAASGLGVDSIVPVASVLTNASHPLHRQGPWVACSMNYLGTNAAPLVPLLIQGTRDTNDHFANGCVQALGSLRQMPEISVPALAKSLRHRDKSIRRWAAENLRRFTSDARPAVPALIAARSDPEYLVRESVERALTEIAPEVLTNAPPR